MTNALTLDDLSDHAHIRMLPVLPALEASQQEALSGALGKLFAQFVREGKITAGCCEWVAGGALLIMAWELADQGPLSGCRHDKITGVLRHHSERLERDLFATPAFVLETDAGVIGLDHASFRAAVGEGVVNGETLAWNVQVDTLGAWRSGGQATITSIDWLDLAFSKAKRALARGA